MDWFESLLNAGNVMLLAIVIIGYMILKRTVYIVPQSRNFVVERFGRFSRVLKPGLNVVVPFLDRVAHRISVLERQTEPSHVSVFSSDNVEVEIVTVVYWRVHDAQLSVYRIEDVSTAIMVATGSIVRNIGAGLELDKLQGSREEINRQMKDSLGETAEAWGVEITRTEIIDIGLDDKTKEAQRQQVEAERARRAQVTSAEGQAEAVKLEADSVLYRSEKEAQAVVLAAESRAKEIGLVAEARANEIRLVAAAQAREIELVGTAMRDFGEKAAMFELGKRQVDAMEKMANGRGSRMLVLPTDVTRMIGTLTALAEGVGFAGFDGSHAAEGMTPGAEETNGASAEEAGPAGA